MAPISPVIRTAPAMGDRENDNFRRESLVEDAEGKLPKRIFSNIGDIDRPTLRAISDSS
jgi:hypothetical protein